MKKEWIYNPIKTETLPNGLYGKYLGYFTLRVWQAKNGRYLWEIIDSSLEDDSDPTNEEHKFLQETQYRDSLEECKQIAERMLKEILLEECSLL